MLNKILQFVGFEAENVSLTEKLASTLGGFLSIFLIAVITFKLTDSLGSAIIVPSMGASAVLLFAVPHGKLSQPWSLFGGHLVSAAIGVSCQLIIPDMYLAAGLAVGLSIGAMHLANCIHPPGGATALAAVIGGPAIHSLGYSYILAPILINTFIIFFVAVIFNSIFPWRRYPANLMKFVKEPVTTDADESFFPITKTDLNNALEEMDLLVDITSDDFLKLFKLASRQARLRRMSPEQIQLGHYYTNGRKDNEWQVRQIIDEAPAENPDKDIVIYRVAEGQGLHSSDSCTRSQFALWADSEVFHTKK